MFPKSVCMGEAFPFVAFQASANLITALAYLFLCVVIVRVMRHRPFIKTDTIFFRVYLAYAVLFCVASLDRMSSIVVLWTTEYFMQTITKWLTALTTPIAAIVIARALPKGLIGREQRALTTEEKINLLLADVQMSRAAYQNTISKLHAYTKELRTTPSKPISEVVETLDHLIQSLQQAVEERAG